VKCGQFRRQFFDLNDLLKPMAKIANLGGVNITSSPRCRLAGHRTASVTPLHGLQLSARTWCD
jgi:hypothetical protein